MVNLLSRGGLPTLYNGNEILMQGGPKNKTDANVREAFWWKNTANNVHFFEKRNPGEVITTKSSTMKEQLNQLLIIQILHIT
ncbi:hypothetical protein [Mycoplasmopsis cynos]|uniref:hypothetical protein n=1 Tax=Mycoplasmopsis cynos TaxID=171284 RepID=UPI0024C7D6FD|nr:hypothetical protein [Mycoplasmopsis cynos]WAM04857.1 hypothetical protein ONA01_01425 [Mycoplasmopsis cynos]